MTAAYLDQLLAAAGVADGAETEFRQYAERRLEMMTAARVRAHRRYHLVNDMVESARPIVERPAGIAAQIGCVLIQAAHICSSTIRATAADDGATPLYAET